MGVGEGICYHNNDPPHEFQVEIREAKITTMESALSYACKKHKNKKAMGTRHILMEFEEVQKSGKVFKKVSGFVTVTVTELVKESVKFLFDCIIECLGAC